MHDASAFNLLALLAPDFDLDLKKRMFVPSLRFTPATSLAPVSSKEPSFVTPFSFRIAAPDLSRNSLGLRQDRRHRPGSAHRERRLRSRLHGTALLASGAHFEIPCISADINGCKEGARLSIEVICYSCPCDSMLFTNSRY